MSATIQLGSKVKDKYTGLKGVAMARVEYISGCIQYGVESLLPDGKVHETWIDLQRLEVVPGRAREENIPQASTRRYGGPSRTAPPKSSPASRTTPATGATTD